MNNDLLASYNNHTLTTLPTAAWGGYLSYLKFA